MGSKAASRKPLQQPSKNTDKGIRESERIGPVESAGSRTKTERLSGKVLGKFRERDELRANGSLSPFLTFSKANEKQLSITSTLLIS